MKLKNGLLTDPLNLTNNRRIKTYQNPPMTADEIYTSLTANTIMAKLTNHFQLTTLTTPTIDKHYSLDSEDDFRSELPSPGRSHKTNY